MTSHYTIQYTDHYTTTDPVFALVGKQIYTNNYTANYVLTEGGDW